MWKAGWEDVQEMTGEMQALRETLDDLAQASYKRMGDNVRRFRVLQRMTQDGLAEKCLLSAPYISQIERADLYKGVTYQSILQLAHALGVPACILIAKNPCQQYLDCLARIGEEMPLETDMRTKLPE